MNTFALRSQKIVTPDHIFPGTIVIEEGKIAEIADYNKTLSCPLYDKGEKAIMAGLVDTHVHINEPGRTDWEGFYTGTQAAAAGGITTLIDMPLNCTPVTTSADALNTKLHAIKDKLWIDCGFWGGVIPGNINGLEDLLQAGVLGVKSFLIDSGIDDFPPVTATDMREAIKILSRYNVPYLVHAELDTDNVQPPSIGQSYNSFLQSRPAKWENDAIDLIIRLAQEAEHQGCTARMHIVHLSSAQALPAIAAARTQGLHITTETCPHYLTLHAETIPDGKTLFKCCPPIREANNCKQLWQGIKEGLIDFIVSDHSPCLPTLKHIDSGDLEKAWGGISSLQFSLPLIWTEAQQHGLTLSDLTRLMSVATAEFAGLGQQKGKIAEGYDADLIIFDSHSRYAITPELIRFRHKVTPYADKTVMGNIEQTYLRGQLIYDNNTMAGLPLGKPLLKTQVSE